MPGFDRTGPQGAGPMTGHRGGYCNPDGPRSAWEAGFGYGRGCGYGRRAGFCRGRGFRRGFDPGAYRPAYPRIGPTQELEMLKAEAESVKITMDSINKRIQELEKGASDVSA